MKSLQQFYALNMVELLSNVFFLADVPGVIVIATSAVYPRLKSNHDFI